MDQAGRRRVVVVESAPVAMTAWRGVFAREAEWVTTFVPECREAARAAHRSSHAPTVAIINTTCAGSGVASHARDCVRTLVGAGHRVLLRSASIESHPARLALALGAVGAIHRDAPAEAIREAVRVLHAGGTWVDPRFGVTIEEARRRVPLLAGSEETALALYATGLTLESVARKMRVQAGTARTYLERTKRKYRDCQRPIRSRADYTLRAIEDGYLSLG